MPGASTSTASQGTPQGEAGHTGVRWGGARQPMLRDWCTPRDSMGGAEEPSHEDLCDGAEDTPDRREAEEEGGEDEDEEEEEEEDDDEEDEEDEEEEEAEEAEEEEDEEEEEEDDDEEEDWEEEATVAPVKPCKKPSGGAAQAKAPATPAKPKDRSQDASAASKPAASKAAASKPAASKPAASKAVASKPAATKPKAPKAPKEPKAPKAPNAPNAPNAVSAERKTNGDTGDVAGPFLSWRGKFYEVKASSVTVNRLACGAPSATDETAFGMVIDCGVPVTVREKDTLTKLGPGAKQCLFEPGGEIDLQPIHVKMCLAVGDKEAKKENKLSRKLLFSAVSADENSASSGSGPDGQVLRSVPKTVQPKLHSKFCKMAAANPNDKVLQDLLSVWPPDTASHSIDPDLNKCMLTPINIDTPRGRWLSKTTGYQQKAPKGAQGSECTETKADPPAKAAQKGKSAAPAAAPAPAAAAAATPAAASKPKRGATGEATGAPKKRAKVIREGHYPSLTTVETLAAAENPGLEAVQAFRRENGDWAIYYVWKP